MSSLWEDHFAVVKSPADAKRVLRRFQGRKLSALSRPNLLLMIEAMNVVLAQYNPKELQITKSTRW